MFSRCILLSQPTGQHSLGLGLIALQRCSQCILQPHPTRKHSFGDPYLSAEALSVHSTAPADWSTRTLVGESCPSAEMQLVYTTAPADWPTHVGGSYTSSVGYFYSSSRLGNTRLGRGSYFSTEVQSMYSTTPANKNQNYHRWPKPLAPTRLY